MKYAIAIALLGVTSVSAAPYYVGENLQPKNNLSLGFADTPTKKDVAAGRNDTGNIAAIELKGSYGMGDSASLRAGLPFYMASKNVAGTSRNALGNINLGGVWNNSMTSANQAYTYGYSLSGDLYLPTSRKDQADTVAAVNPTTDLYKYTSKATALTPTLGAFIGQDRWSAKTNLGLAYAYLPKSANSRNNKANHLAGTWQLAASWHATPSIHGNIEYNTIYLDSASYDGVNRKFKHAMTPSVSGNYDKMVASAFATIPLDKTTRDLTNVSFGLNAGYTF